MHTNARAAHTEIINMSRGQELKSCATNEAWNQLISILEDYMGIERKVVEEGSDMLDLYETGAGYHTFRIWSLKSTSNVPWNNYVVHYCG
jgi:hypothetical protein